MSLQSFTAGWKLSQFRDHMNGQQTEDGWMDGEMVINKLWSAEKCTFFMAVEKEKKWSKFRRNLVLAHYLQTLASKLSATHSGPHHGPHRDHPSDHPDCKAPQPLPHDRPIGLATCVTERRT